MAIDHAVEANDHARALSLLDQHAPSLLEQGRFRVLGRWFSAIPADELRARPVLAAISVWATLFTRGAQKAANELVALGNSKPMQEPRLVGYVNALRPLLLGIQDLYEEAIPITKAALAQIPTANPFADDVLCTAAAYFFAIAGEEGEARRLLEVVRWSGGESAFVRMYNESMNGILSFQAGRLSEAAARFKSAITPSDRSYNDASGNAWAGVLYALTLYERNDLAKANILLDVHLPVALDVGLPDHIILGHIIRARTAFSNGDIDQSFKELLALENVGYDRGLVRLIAAARVERARLFLIQENVEAAREELDRADDRSVWKRVRDKRLLAHDTEDAVIGRLRLDIWSGDAKKCLGAVEEETARSVKQGRYRRALLLRLLHSLALQRSGQPTAAMDLLAQVLRQASREGFMRIILDEADPVTRLVRRFHVLQQETSARSTDPVLIGYLQKLVQATGAPRLDSVERTDDQLIQPLTRKEIQILEQVAQGYSNNELAARVGLSESTIRTHLRSVNRKLGARSRAEAVAISRRLDVIR